MPIFKETYEQRVEKNKKRDKINSNIFYGLFHFAKKFAVGGTVGFGAVSVLAPAAALPVVVGSAVFSGVITGAFNQYDIKILGEFLSYPLKPKPFKSEYNDARETSNWLDGLSIAIPTIGFGAALALGAAPSLPFVLAAAYYPTLRTVGMSTRAVVKGTGAIKNTLNSVSNKIMNLNNGGLWLKPKVAGFAPSTPAIEQEFQESVPKSNGIKRGIARSTAKSPKREINLGINPDIDLGTNSKPVNDNGASQTPALDVSEILQKDEPWSSEEIDAVASHVEAENIVPLAIEITRRHEANKKRLEQANAYYLKKFSTLVGKGLKAPEIIEAKEFGIYNSSLNRAKETFAASEVELLDINERLTDIQKLEVSTGISRQLAHENNQLVQHIEGLDKKISDLRQALADAAQPEAQSTVQQAPSEGIKDMPDVLNETAANDRGVSKDTPSLAEIKARSAQKPRISYKSGASDEALQALYKEAITATKADPVQPRAASGSNGAIVYHAPAHTLV